MEVTLTIPHGPHLLALDGNGGVQDTAFLPVVGMQECTVGGIEVEPHPLSCLRTDIQHLLQLLRVTGKKDKISGVG